MKPRDVLIWLSHIEGMNWKIIDFFIKRFDDLSELWYVKDDVLKNLLNRHSIIVDKMIKSRTKYHLHEIMEKLQKGDITPLTILDEKYPNSLRYIANPPHVIYVKGTNINFALPSVAIVGARRASPYGRWAAYQFAKELSEWGIGIVSGLALGVDASSHQGALDGQGHTIGVLGCGLDQYYPPSNRNLTDRVVEKGCIVSEYILGTPPLRHHFPARNRIISGLSDATIVIEASEKSGALITVDYALDQGKEVFSLPGNINSIQSKGTNRLIRDGAKVLLEASDVIEVLKQKYELEKKDTNKLIQIKLSDKEKKIYEIIKSGPIQIDRIAHRSQLSISQLNAILTILEIKGYIDQLPGKIFTVSK